MRDDDQKYERAIRLVKAFRNGELKKVYDEIIAERKRSGAVIRIANVEARCNKGLMIAPE